MPTDIYIAGKNYYAKITITMSMIQGDLFTGTPLKVPSKEKII